MTTLRWMLAAFCFAGTAQAVPKVAVQQFTGPHNAEVREQLMRQLCDTLECAPLKSVMGGSKIDFGKVSDEKVRAVISGRVNAVGKLAALYVTVQGADRDELIPKKRYPLKDFKLDRKELSNAVRDISEALAGAKEPGEGGKAKKSKSSEEESEDPLDSEESEPVASKSKSKRPADEEEEEAAPKKSKRSSDDEEEAPPKKSRRASSDDEEEESTKSRRSRNKSDDGVLSSISVPPVKVTARGDVGLGKPGLTEYFASLTAGLEIFSRNFDYTGLTAGTLRRYNAGFILSPGIAGDIYPFVAQKGFVSGLGAELGFAFSAGLTSRQSQSSNAPHPTSLTRFDFAVKYKFSPISTSDFQGFVALGYRRIGFSVGEAEDTSRIDGLPNVIYNSLRIGLGAQIPVAGRFTPFARLDILPVLSAGDIVGPTYFPKGGAFGFELGLGTGIRLSEHWDLMVQARLTRFGLSFTADPGAPYVATGASDFQVGGTLAARYLF